jgi:hypothetical protein
MHKEAVGMLDVDESLVVVAIEAFEIWNMTYFGGTYLHFWGK